MTQLSTFLLLCTMDKSLCACANVIYVQYAHLCIYLAQVTYMLSIYPSPVCVSIYLSSILIFYLVRQCHYYILLSWKTLLPQIALPPAGSMLCQLMIYVFIFVCPLIFCYYRNFTSYNFISMHLNFLSYKVKIEISYIIKS